MNQDLESDSVCLGHHNRSIREDVAQKQRAFISHCSVVWEVQWTWCLVRCHFPDGHLFFVTSDGRKGGVGGGWLSSMKALIPVITQRPGLKGPSQRGFIFQHTNLGAAQAFNPQQMSCCKSLISFFYIHLFSSVQFSHSVMSDSL